MNGNQVAAFLEVLPIVLVSTSRRSLTCCTVRKVFAITWLSCAWNGGKRGKNVPCLATAYDRSGSAVGVMGLTWVRDTFLVATLHGHVWTSGSC